MRLVKFLANAGVASRRAAEEIIRDGRVTVAGAIVLDPAFGVQEDANVTVDGDAVKLVTSRGLAVYAVHKPAGVVSTASDPQGRRTVVSMVRTDARLYPVGRLDADTTGLILLTNDGELAHRLTHPSFEVDKTYRAVVRNPPIRAGAMRTLEQGVRLEDGVTGPARVTRISSDTLELTIHEGRKRQVRRMLEEVGHPVVTLQRVRFGPLRLGELPAGSYRRLSAQEVSLLRSAGSGAGRGQASSSGAPRKAPSGSRSGAGRRRAASP